MPGIFGVFRKNAARPDENQRLIEAMAEQLSHNPEYHCQTHAEDHFALGNIGLPVAGEERFVVTKQAIAAFSGYIYGFKNLSSELQDTTSRKASRLVELQRRFRLETPKKIDGCFDAAVFFREDGEGVLFNDRLGHRQLYLYEDEHVFLFSCEIKALFAYPSLSRTVDRDAAQRYFNYGYILGDRTFVEGVRLMRGSHTICLRRSEIRAHQYWEFHFGEESTASISELVEEVDATYRGVLSRILDYGREVLVPLSGGLDSRFIAGQLVRAGIKPHCFGHGHRGCDDHLIGARVARTLGIDDYRLIETEPEWLLDKAERFIYLGDGMGGIHHGLLLAIGERYNLPPATTSLLNGIFGGPGNFGSGYFREDDLSRRFTHEEKLLNLRRSLFGDVVDEGFLRMFSSEFREQMVASYERVLDEEFRRCLEVSDDFAHQKDVFFIRNRLVRFMNQADSNRYLWHDHFVLYDDRLIDFYLRLPAQLKLKRAFFYEYFKTCFPELAAIPYQYTGASLYHTPSPLVVSLRRSMKTLGYKLERISRGQFNYYDTRNYHHFDQWFRTERRISAFFRDLLLDKRTLDRGYFDRKGIEKMFRWQLRGGKGFYLLSWLASFELFHRVHIDRP